MSLVLLRRSFGVCKAIFVSCGAGCSSHRCTLPSLSQGEVHPCILCIDSQLVIPSLSHLSFVCLEPCKVPPEDQLEGEIQCTA